MPALFFELKILRLWGCLIIATILGILRASGLVSPADASTWAGWVSFLEFIYPILFPLLIFTFLEREKSWRTLETLVTTPYRKAWIFLKRYLISMLAAFLGIVVAVRPREYVTIMGPGLALGSLALLGGLILGEEMGLGLSLSWWGFSFAVVVAKGDLLHSRIASWFLLILGASPLSPADVALRKWVHFGIGLAILLCSLIVAERKRSWSLR